MKLKTYILCIFSLLSLGCSDDTEETIINKSLTTPGLDAGRVKAVSYSHHIRPLIETKCVACHACYDSPCQLNLASAEGLLRGANKRPVYDSTRLQAAPPTRLFIDAQDPHGWRQLGFFSVIDGADTDRSLLLNMLRLGRANSFKDNVRIGRDIGPATKRDNACPTAQEFSAFAKNNPDAGMPYAVTGLSEEEFTDMATWLQQGATFDHEEKNITGAEQQQIQTWETFFNGPQKRQQLVARYLYEHLFIAHLYFDELNTPNFFRLVRSTTPPGETIVPIATPRPNDDPGKTFWYRLMPMEEVIVYKTHITYALNARRISRWHELFLATDWSIDKLPGHSIEERSNPFTTFSPIPAGSRYRFMLDDADFFVRTFIRGPVCHGQIATDVIRDRFWNLFQSPETDLYINNASYRNDVSNLLAVPGINDGLEDFLLQWIDYRSRNKQYLKKRQAVYAKLRPQGPQLSDIWDGDGYNAGALQTIFRHHNNASVQAGLIGDTPKTIWVMDYALFERSFYVLVGNFDVFGSLPHQTLTRLYFDLIRNGAEQNFLRFMPATQRKDIIDDWYQGTAQLKLFLTYDEVDTKSPTAVPYTSTKAKTEFGKLIKQAMPGISAQLKSDSGFNRVDHLLMPLTRENAASLPVINFMPDVIFLRVFDENGNRQVYSILRDRAHTNVAFMLAEELRYQSKADRLTIYPGILGSYPNFIFSVPLRDISDFTRTLQAVKTRNQFGELIDNWGIRRSHPDFWAIFHDFTAYLKETNPREAGVFDMNRFLNF